MADGKASGIVKFFGVGTLLVLSLLGGVGVAIILGMLMNIGGETSRQILSENIRPMMIAVLAGEAVGVAILFLLLRLFRRGSTENYAQVVFVALILMLGVAVYRGLASLREAPARVEQPVARPLVETQTVYVETMKMNVRGFGTVQPRTEVDVVPQVAGRVVQCHRDFVNGGFFEAHEPLIMIEKKDYELAVQNAASAVAAAEVALAREQAEALVARQEWQQLHPGTEPSSPLVLREPQVKQAQAQLQAGQAQYSKALLDLNRTEVSLPFNGRIWQKSVDLGQYVTPGQPIARVYGTDVVEIVVPLEDRELQWFDVPNMGAPKDNPGRPGPIALLKAEFAGRQYTWQGRVARTQGRIDEAARTVPVVVEVTEPFDSNNGRPPLVPGMFIEDVEIQGRPVSGIVRIPRYALRKGRHVWVTEGERLRVREVTIARQDEQFVYVSQGLSDGDHVVISSLDAVSDGMEIRTEPQPVGDAAMQAEINDEH